ncbi:unnamed protein product [Cyclocybe aegerita]|uniref:Uncharacterized protein n=1 Tax=Cyclocybe aegerita TaxID=1973307 RepID=A0A8S0W5D1_CYCAE|nr:unnamed protein product [Cyclocybe aegerita]
MKSNYPIFLSPASLRLRQRNHNALPGLYYPRRLLLHLAPLLVFLSLASTLSTRCAAVSSSATIDQPSTCHQRLAAIIIPTNPSSASRPSRPMATLSTTARRIHSTTDCLSMSMTVEDTFEFMHNRPTRRRVESDASSFYFHAPASQQNGGCGHRRQQSNMSVSSLAPPIGLYNRSFGHHRRNDSSASTNSVAVSFPKHGTNPGVPA